MAQPTGLSQRPLFCYSQPPQRNRVGLGHQNSCKAVRNSVPGEACLILAVDFLGPFRRRGEQQHGALMAVTSSLISRINIHIPCRRRAARASQQQRDTYCCSGVCCCCAAAMQGVSTAGFYVVLCITALLWTSAAAACTDATCVQDALPLRGRQLKVGWERIRRAAGITHGSHICCCCAGVQQLLH